MTGLGHAEVDEKREEAVMEDQELIDLVSSPRLARPCSLSVVVPTRNEALNVGPLTARLKQALDPTVDDWEVIFVDDSDDHTPRAVGRLIALGLPVRVLHRGRGQRWGGLGGAVCEGFALAKSDLVAVMDADLQHPPELLPALVATVASGQADLVSGSRYGPDGADAGLSGPWRRIVSTCCRGLVHFMVPRSRSLEDPLSGFFALRRSLVEGAEMRPDGYKILLEVVVRTRPGSVRNLGFKFAPRHAGRSKASWREGLVFLRHVGRLAISDRKAGSSPPDTVGPIVPAPDAARGRTP